MADDAIISGLRLIRNEAQLTRVVATVAQADRRFATGFVKAILAVAEENPRHRRAVKGLGEVPAELECQSEHSLHDSKDDGLGRVDLRFDGGEDFTLFVENKLHSGYGKEQLERYRAALELLPKDRSRRGLVAVTRNVPGYGDLPPKTEAWLGSVRWTHMLSDLRRLRPVNQRVTDQWLTLLDVLQDQGDLGMTTVNSDLINAWSQYLTGREHLADILDGIWENALGALRRELKRKYRTAGPEEKLADIWRKGVREKVILQRGSRSVWVGFSVPAVVAQPAVIVQFDNTFRRPLFMVGAEIWDGHERIQKGEPQLRRASKQLQSEGFVTNSRHKYWTKVHGPDEWLEGVEDVPATLSDLAERDIRLIVSSGILTGDLEAARKRSWRGGPPKRKRR